MELTGKIVLITGASTGIGKSLAFEFAKYNCKLVLIARRIELLDEIKKEIAANPKSKTAIDDILTFSCDVSDNGQIAETYNAVKEKFGQIDIALLNAGIGKNITVENYNIKDAQLIFGANVFGIINWVEQLLPDFVKNRNGVIAGVSSLADNRGFSGSGFYCASKAAATIYLEGLRVELKPFNVKVITVKPGFVKTPMTDQNKFEMPFLMSPEEAAQIIVNGIISERRIIQFPWQMVLITRLIGLLPSALYEWIAGKAKVR